MELLAPEKEFLAYWRGLAPRWGIPPNVATAIGLLFIRDDALSAAEIGKMAGLSRGATQSAIKELDAWKVLSKHTQGRRTAYSCDLDLVELLVRVMVYRRRTDITPSLAALRSARDGLKRSGARDSYSAARIEQAIELLSMADTSYARLAKVPPSRLRFLFNLAHRTMELLMRNG